MSVNRMQSERIENEREGSEPRGKIERLPPVQVPTSAPNIEEEHRWEEQRLAAEGVRLHLPTGVTQH